MKNMYKVQRNDKGTDWKTVTVFEFKTIEEAAGFIRGFLYHTHGKHDYNFSIMRPNGWAHVPACAMSIKAIRNVQRSISRIGKRRRR